MLKLIIGNKNYSSWSLRPWFFMKQMGLPFVEHRVALYEAESDSKLEAYFSNYKVPVLQNDALIVWDSLAIMEYLSDTHLDNRGWPQASEIRAVARSISAEMHSSFTALRSALPMNCRKQFQNFDLTTDVQKDIRRIEQIWRYCRQRYSQAGGWLFGDFSIADAMFAPVVLRFQGYGVPLDAVAKEYMQWVMTNTHLQDWVEAGRCETEVIAEDEAESVLP